MSLLQLSHAHTAWANVKKEVSAVAVVGLFAKHVFAALTERHVATVIIVIVRLGAGVCQGSAIFNNNACKTNVTKGGAPQALRCLSFLSSSCEFHFASI